ncbi:RHS repeat-associated core domain-containing protein [Pseudomonas sp. SIMBA_077]
MQKTLLCTYHYDPLDRLINAKTEPQADSLRFYCQSRLATEIQGSMQHSIMQHGDQLLAQQTRQANQHISTLLATDLQRSVLQTTSGVEQQTIAYSPFGHHANQPIKTHLLGFNGERTASITGHYLLGNGYRAFNPVLMRFNSPDSWSPFGKAGVNAYAYCMNNPVLTEDPSGHLFEFVGRLAKNFFSGGINLKKYSGHRSRVKIKRGISVSQAYKARDRMAEIEPFTYITVAKNKEYLDDLIRIDTNNPYIPTLNLQEQAISVLHWKNISTHTLPTPIQRLAAIRGKTTPPHYATIKKIKLGDYDPKVTKPGLKALFDDIENPEQNSYLSDLHARADILSFEQWEKYESILKKHFSF